ncbi:MAG: NAD(P)H-dependent oxidoreductase subunit E [Elusimicrobia bacterium]|nr:NAD(P)H-dependent oxidoreductase subunit E [Elusimicrobiota bacterium]
MEQWLLEILNTHKNNPDALIPILQKIQNKLGYIPEKAVGHISNFFKISASKIFGVASFYSQFRFTKPPKHSIKVCLGTACYVRAGAEILDSLEKELGITCGGITPDKKFGLESVSCFGCCALSPVVVIDNKVYSRMTPQKAKKEIKKLRK